MNNNISRRDSVSLFSNDREALFKRRPNRFLIIAGDGNEEIPCHCPNPGRLIEFLFPGTRLILEKRKNNQGKTAWTAAGLYYENRTVPLFSARANQAAEKLILPKIIPGLREIKHEYTIGHSRFDFICTDDAGNKHIIEVKACSLVEFGTAMFPDAPSSRAAKHLEELACLAKESYICHILFVIVHGTPDVFIPNLHTDPVFAAALSNCSGKVQVHAALLETETNGQAHLADSEIPVDLSHGKLAGENRGNYLILMEIPEQFETDVGALGSILFHPGWYVYAGSARKNLSQRINRHLRKIRKQKHWHMDYITGFAKMIKGFPIFSYHNLECGLAGELKHISSGMIPGFGSSDCTCESHLAYFKTNPMQNRDFIEMLMRYRHRDALKK